MANSITKVNVTQQVAPTPSGLQQSGAFISVGGTSLTANSTKLLTQLSDLTSILVLPINLASITQSNGLATATIATTTISSGTYNTTTGLVTLTLAANIGLTPGASVIVSGATGTGSFASINGTFTAIVGTLGTTLEYTIATGLTMTITGGSVEPNLGTTADQYLITIGGANQAGYNGTFLATIASATTFTFAVPSSTVSPATGVLTYTQRNVAELSSMGSMFFGQGANVAVSVLELGPNEPAAGIAALNTWITNNPGVFYAYLVPRSWASQSSYLTFVANFESTTAQTYFFTTMTLANYTSFSAAMKCVYGWVESPGIATTEFQLAADFFRALALNPSNTNKVAPFAFGYLFGVTPYPLSGNGPTLAALQAAGVNYAGTGQQGGISLTCSFYGTTMDGNPFTYWYAVDWAVINVTLDINNAVINGANNPVNPLYYNQDGINRLQSIAAGTMNSGITFGMVLGNVTQTEFDGPALALALESGVYDNLTVVNAVPFVPYSQANPGDYKIGKYAGFSIQFTPLRGFESIIFNVVVSSFVAGNP